MFHVHAQLEPGIAFEKIRGDAVAEITAIRLMMTIRARILSRPRDISSHLPSVFNFLTLKMELLFRCTNQGYDRFQMCHIFGSMFARLGSLQLAV